MPVFHWSWISFDVVFLLFFGATSPSSTSTSVAVQLLSSINLLKDKFISSGDPGVRSGAQTSRGGGEKKANSNLEKCITGTKNVSPDDAIDVENQIRSSSQMKRFLFHKS